MPTYECILQFLVQERKAQLESERKEALEKAQSLLKDLEELVVEAEVARYMVLTAPLLWQSVKIWQKYEIIMTNI